MKGIKRIFKIISFVIFYLKEVIVSSVQVALEVLSPGHRMSPAIIAVPLDLRSESSINLLANLITMTPGTMTVDVHPQKTWIYVYALNVTDQEEFKKEIKEKFEKRVMEVMGQ